MKRPRPPVLRPRSSRSAAPAPEGAAFTTAGSASRATSAGGRGASQAIKGMHSLTDPPHVLRQKKLCGELDCKRCQTRNDDEECIGELAAPPPPCLVHQRRSRPSSPRSCICCRQVGLLQVPLGHRQVLPGLPPHQVSGRACRSCCRSCLETECRISCRCRYGEDLDEIRKQMAAGTWLCPHCYEDDHPDEGWICNSSICMTRCV